MIDWSQVKSVLIVRLRSIGDTVLTTPSLIALRRFLPDARIDILLEDWVAPLLEGSDLVDRTIRAGKDSRSRFRTAMELRRNGYDVAINLHGGTTATFFVRASGAAHRVGYAHYRYRFLHNHLLSSSADFWQREPTHSAEQQMALLGFVGVPVDGSIKTRLTVSPAAAASMTSRLEQAGIGPGDGFALIHPVAAFDTKQWATENFAAVADHFAGKGLRAIAVATRKERPVLEKLQSLSRVPVTSFDDLTLPEITALASKATGFVGNDSGIAHIAGAVGTPCVVVFGSSNINHWRPWTDAPNEVVLEKLPCQPCAGYSCEEFGEPKCILSVRPESVIAAIDRVIR